MTQHHRGQTIRLTLEQEAIGGRPGRSGARPPTRGQTWRRTGEVSLAHTVSAALNLLMSVVSEKSRYSSPRR